MTRAEQFEELRPMLFAIAYRILGSVSEAEDAVQETWLRYESSPTQPTSTKAFLSAVVTRGAGAAPMDAGRPRFEADSRERDELAARFFDALREGDVEGLQELLAADVQMTGDGGGKAPALTRTIFGAANVARVLAAGFPLLVRTGVAVERHEVNGQPGAILRDRDGKVLTTLALDILDGRIQTIRSVINPDKLGHVGPVADAWAVAREVNQARRLRD
jgi:ketosteroid isomerase-like protein